MKLAFCIQSYFIPLNIIESSLHMHFTSLSLLHQHTSLDFFVKKKHAFGMSVCVNEWLLLPITRCGNATLIVQERSSYIFCSCKIDRHKIYKAN